METKQRNCVFGEVRILSNALNSEFVASNSKLKTQTSEIQKYGQHLVGNLSMYTQTHNARAAKTHRHTETHAGTQTDTHKHAHMRTQENTHNSKHARPTI